MLNISLNKTENILKILILFVICGPNYGSGLDVSLISIFILYIIIFSHKFNLTINFKIEFIILILITLIALISSIINGGILNSTFLIKPIKILVALILFTILYRKYGERLFFDVIILAGVINTLVIFLQLLNIIEWYNPQFVLHYDVSFRKPGLFAGYPDSGLTALASSLICMYLFKIKNEQKYLILSFFIALGVLITSRTALLLYMFSLFFYIVFFFKVSQVIKTIIITLIITIFLFLIGNIFPESMIQKIYDFSFEMFLNYKKNGNISTDSSDDLLYNHFNIPNDLFTLIIGNSIEPFSMKGSYFSDVFYIRTLWGVGLISLFLYFLLLLYMFIRLIFLNSYLSKVCAILFFVMFLSCFKGPFFISRGFGDILLILYIISINKSNKSYLGENH